MRARIPFALNAAVVGTAALALVGATVQGWQAAAVVALALVTGSLLFLVHRRLKVERRNLLHAHACLAEFRVPTCYPEPDSAIVGLSKAYEQLVQELLRKHDQDVNKLKRYEFITQHTDDLVMQVDSRGVIKYASPSSTMQLGYSPEELVGQRAFDFIHEDDQPEWLRQLKSAAKHRRSVILEGRWRHRNGSCVTLELSLRHAFGLNGQVVETISMGRNVDARNALRDKLTTAARTDTLTGLLNRAALVEALEGMQSRCASQPFGLFLFDLDRFKQVNDSLGHAAGDSYLVETAHRVKAVLRDSDVLARMGGDEFVAIVKGQHSADSLRNIAERVIEEVSKPYQCHGQLLFPKTSIGVLLCNEPGLATDELISRADRAMYVAKSQGGNLAVVYDESHADTLKQSFAVEQMLTRALEEQRLELQFQPIVRAKDKVQVLAEALVRIRTEQGQLIGPGQFIEVAEKTGLIFQVGQWVLQQACLHVKALQDQGSPVSVSVNVSPRQLMHVNYVESVEATIAQTGAAPHMIVLEVTESAVMQDVERARATLAHLRRLGFKLALDDFGSGYSSISMLRNLPFDILKIDRQFAADASRACIGPSTLGSIIDIGKSLNLTIVAEGVEHSDQAIGLERLGCDLLQGYLYHRPMPSAKHLFASNASWGPLVTGVAVQPLDEVLIY